MRQNFIGFDENPIDKEDRYGFGAYEGTESGTESEDTQFSIEYY